MLEQGGGGGGGGGMGWMDKYLRMQRGGRIGEERRMSI